MQTLSASGGFLRPARSRAKTPRLGNEIHPHTGLALKLDYTCLEEHASETQIQNLARQAARLRGASLVVRSEALDHAREVVKPEDALKLTAAVGYPRSEGLPEQEELLREVQSAVSQQVDEVEVYLPSPGAIASQLPALVEAAGRTPVRLALPKGLSQSELRQSCQIAQELGARFVKTESAGELATMAAACELTLCLGGNLAGQAAALPIMQAYPKRRLRFATHDGERVVAQEIATWKDEIPAKNAELQAQLSSPGGRKFRGMIEGFRQQMIERIEGAHQEGRPVAFMSVCIRPNDVNSVEDNMQVRSELRQTCQKAGAAFIDPFELLEPVVAAIRAGEVEGEVIEEVLMDPEAGLWPDLVRRCDVMIHGDRWKFAQGAREEHELAEFYGIPTWDGSGRPALRGEVGPPLRLHSV